MYKIAFTQSFHSLDGRRGAVGTDLYAVSHGFVPYQRLQLFSLEQETIPSLLSTGWFQE